VTRKILFFLTIYKKKAKKKSWHQKSFCGTLETIFEIPFFLFILRRNVTLTFAYGIKIKNFINPRTPFPKI